MPAIVTTLVNTALATTALVALHMSPTVNTALNAWYREYHSLLSHRLCEGVVAVAAFAVWAFSFFILEVATNVPKLKTKVVEQPLPSSTANGSTAAGAIIQAYRHDGKGTVYFSVESQKPRERGESVRLSEGFLFWLASNVVVYLGIIDVSQRVMGDSLNALHFADIDPPSIVRLVVEVSFSVWAYDFLFFWIHRSWHAAMKRTGWWSKLHLLHHDHYQNVNAPLTPMATFHHHFLDATGQVMINIIVQQVPLFFLFSGPRHKLSKVLHNIVVTYLLVEAHSGYDLPFMSHRVFPWIFGGSVRHQIHHQYGTVFFHQFFKYLDDWV